MAWIEEIPLIMHNTRNTVVIYLLLLATGLFVGHLQVNAIPGVPAHGRYHASDMDDLQMQIYGQSARPKNYAAGADHPAWYFICGVYQKTSAALGLKGMRLWNIAVPCLLGLNLVLLMALTRQIGFSTSQAVGLTAVWLGSGATINWSVVLETHVLAPTSLLLAALIITHPRLIPRIWNQASTPTLAALGLSIAVAACITITNGMLAALAMIPARFMRRAQPLRLAHESLRRLPTLLTAVLVGIGILGLVHTTGWYLVQDPTMRHFLEILGERRLLPYMEGSWWDSLLAFAWIAPPMSEYTGDPPETMMIMERNWATAPAYFSGLIVFILTVVSIRFHSARTMFMPLFVMFGFALHSIYGLSESFLFSANYTWATVISIGLIGRSMCPRSLGWILLCLGAVMLVINVAIWKSGIDWIVENGYLIPTSP